jgi:hypothetical protein
MEEAMPTAIFAHLFTLMMSPLLEHPAAKAGRRFSQHQPQCFFDRDLTRT